MECLSLLKLSRTVSCACSAADISVPCKPCHSLFGCRGCYAVVMCGCVFGMRAICEWQDVLFQFWRWLCHNVIVSEPVRKEVLSGMQCVCVCVCVCACPRACVCMSVCVCECVPHTCEVSRISVLQLLNVSSF